MSDMSTTTSMTSVNVRMYILCHTEEIFKSALTIYKEYSWACPIIMKYQDYTFENAFWKQLLEIKEDWIKYDMVGIMSFKAYKKISISNVNDIIHNKNLWESGYYHFMEKNRTYIDDRDCHPNLVKIMEDISKQLNIRIHEMAYCNFFMCSPEKMLKFIPWVTKILIPAVINHPLSMTDAKYGGDLSSNDCLQKFGIPHYPHAPFVIERFTKSFFIDKIRHTKIFCISHDDSQTGAPIALKNVFDFIVKSNIDAELLFLKDIHKDTFIDYMQTSTSSPLVICNTLVTYNIVKLLSKTTIPVFWYIHEWLDAKHTHHYPYIFADKSIFTCSNIRLIFPCISAYNNLKSYFTLTPNIFILPSSYNLQSLKDKSLCPISFTSNKCILSIVGTIDSRKNQQNFINNVFYRLRDNFPNILLLLVGKVCNDINILPNYNDSIVITGEVKNSLPYTNKADIHVSYSINEVLPLNVLEAMYCKKPIVTSNAGGISEYIKHNKNGFIFNVNDSNTCYNLIAKLIMNENVRRQIGLEAYETFVQVFNEQNVLPAFIKNIQQCS